MKKLAYRKARADAYDVALAKLAGISKRSDDMRFEEYESEFPHSGDVGRGVRVSSVPGKWKGPKWNNTAPLPSKEGYLITVRRDPPRGSKNFEHPYNERHGERGPYALLDNEDDLYEQLHDYGKYLEAMHRSNTYSPKERRKILYTEVDSPEMRKWTHGKGYGAGGNIDPNNDPLPSDNYTINLRRRGRGLGRMTPTELEYAEKLKDYWNYLQFAQGVRSAANKDWNDMWEKKFPASEVERKG